MNFDANTLSALMQLLGAQKQPRNDSYAENNNATVGNQNYSYSQTSRDGNGNNFDKSYSQPNRNSANSRPNGLGQSVFAMQNGLGETVDFSGQSQNNNTQKSQPSQNANPLSALLEMMTGKSSDSANGDMMSSLMPMLLNMMSGKTKSNSSNSAPKTQTASETSSNAVKAAPDDSESENKSDNDDLKKYKAMFEEAMKKERESSAKQNPSNEKCDNREKETHKKTQPIYKDKFEPIAFAGYALISALNKLYIAKRV